MDSKAVLENQTSTTFSIYKLDIDALVNDEDNKIIFKDDMTALEKVTAYINIRLESLDNTYKYANDNSFHTYLFNSGNTAKWKDFILTFFNDQELTEDTFQTKFPSYIIIKELNGSIYFMTAGLANSVFGNYKDKTFGLDLVPKLIDENDLIIKHIADHRVYGNRNTVNYVNRTESAFNSELTYEAIYKEMGITAKKDIQSKIGIYINEDSGDTPISFGAGLHIGKRLSANELNNIINTIDALWKDNTKIKFALGYIVDANRKGMKQSEITENYFDAVDKGTGEIDIAYNPELYYNIGNYVLINAKNEVLTSIMKDAGVYPLTNINDVIKIIKSEVSKNKRTRNFMKHYYLLNNDQRIKLFDLLEVSHQYNNSQLYLIDGTWYVFDINYLDYLDRKFDRLITDSRTIYNENLLSVDVNYLGKSFKNEEELKDEIKKSKTLINSDMRYYKGIEIADAIYCHDNTIYFFHNKSSFDAKGCRDLLGQIDSSSNYLTNMIGNYTDNQDSINKYISDLKNNNLTKTEYVDRLDTLLKSSLTKIMYIAYFTDKISTDVKSNYVKYLLETTQYKLKARGHGFIVI